MLRAIGPSRSSLKISRRSPSPVARRGPWWRSSRSSTSASPTTSTTVAEVGLRLPGPAQLEDAERGHIGGEGEEALEPCGHERAAPATAASSNVGARVDAVRARDRVVHQRGHLLAQAEHVRDGLDQQLGAAGVGAREQLEEVRVGGVEVARRGVQLRALRVVRQARVLLERIDRVPVDLERRAASGASARRRRGSSGRAGAARSGSSGPARARRRRSGRRRPRPARRSAAAPRWPSAGRSPGPPRRRPSSSTRA